MQNTSPPPIILLASPVYWPQESERSQLAEAVAGELRGAVAGIGGVTVVDGPDALDRLTGGDGQARVLVPLSGGVQPWMARIAESSPALGLFNGYLPEALPEPLAGRLMHANAHPACTDFHAHCRLHGKPIEWLSTLAELGEFIAAATAAASLRGARLLKIGETEPWVINSCRDPATIRARMGTEVIPLERDQLYAVVGEISDSEARAEAEAWLATRPELLDIGRADIEQACRVTAAMRKLLADHRADGLSMACFAMIGDIDTTSCLALSALNSSATSIGACEGDLDAALTLLLLKSLGADFVWIANPIIHPGDYVDLAHCTAPVCGCGRTFPFRLMRHHESGRGVSPEVQLPDGETATAARLSVNAGRIVAHQGITERREKLPACHTQIRLHVASSRRLLDSLPGTHLVLSFGNYLRRLEMTAAQLGLEFAGSGMPADNSPRRQPPTANSATSADSPSRSPYAT